MRAVPVGNQLKRTQTLFATGGSHPEQCARKTELPISVWLIKYLLFFSKVDQYDFSKQLLYRNFCKNRTV